VLSRQADGVLLVVEAGRTRQKEARRTMEELSRVNAPVLGVVINKISVGRRGGYYYYQYYHDESHEKHSVDSA
jgi:Mrp family chromosome partitioning ATPase